MSTRCTIHFHDGPGETSRAIVYRHADGYPEGDHGVLKDLGRFFDAVEAQTKDTRFGDPEYLAAKYVVWQAKENAVKFTWNGDTYEIVPSEPLDFLSLGVTLKDPADIEYRYHVRCTLFDGFAANARPKVDWEKA